MQEVRAVHRVALRISGSTSLNVSNLLDHTTSEEYKIAMTRMRADHAKASGESPAMSSTIGRYLSTIDKGTQARMRRKFDVCYTMAKESIPFAKYPALLALEACHGVDLGPAYSTPDSAKIFTGYIAASQHQAFVNTFPKSHFCSFLMDGTTDAGNQEDGLVVFVDCSRYDTTQEITPRTRTLVHSQSRAGRCQWSSGVPWRRAEASGCGQCPRHGQSARSGRKASASWSGTDEAAVKVGEHSGLKGQLQRALPWLFWSWCYAYRLELACKDAVSTPCSPVEKRCCLVYTTCARSLQGSHESLPALWKI